MRATKKPGFLDIPLSHVEKEFHPERIITEISSDFAVSKSEYIAPYQWFTTNKFIAFNEDKQVAELPLRYNNHKYTYEPAGYKEFMPETFDFSFMAKRDDSYSSIEDYDLKVGVYDQVGAKDFASQLMAIFGDASYRGVSPANVKVNGRDKNPEKLLVKNTENLDWLIVQTKDAVTTKDGSVAAINYSDLMKTGCNIWVTLSDEGMSAFMKKSEAPYKLKAKDIGLNELGGEREYLFTSSYSYQAKTNNDYDGLDAGQLKIILDGRINSPIIILEKNARGYIVISHERMFSEKVLKYHASFIYNILVSGYLKGYVFTQNKELWITNDVVDYMGSVKTPLRKTHPSVNTQDMINGRAKKFSIAEYTISKPDVMLEMIDTNGNVHFNKILTTDPKRQNGEVSVYTTQGTVMFYKQDEYLLVEDEVHFFSEIDDEENCYVTIEPFVSSSNRLVVSRPKKMKIEYLDIQYDVYALPIGVDGESEVMLIEHSKWKTMGAAVKIASIHVEFQGEPAAYDIRLLGGGLPSEYTDYEMMDIGHVKGRPYRVGVAAVIELPKKYQIYDERIKESVDRYKVAADQIYVTYKD